MDRFDTLSNFIMIYLFLSSHKLIYSSFYSLFFKTKNHQIFIIKEHMQINENIPRA